MRSCFWRQVTALQVRRRERRRLRWAWGAAAGEGLPQPFPTEVLMWIRKALSSTVPGCSAPSALLRPDRLFPKLLRKHSLPQEKSSETFLKFSWTLHIASSSWLTRAAGGGTLLPTSQCSQSKQRPSTTPRTAASSLFCPGSRPCIEGLRSQATWQGAVPWHQAQPEPVQSFPPRLSPAKRRLRSCPAQA